MKDLQYQPVYEMGEKIHDLLAKQGVFYDIPDKHLITYCFSEIDFCHTFVEENELSFTFVFQDDEKKPRLIKNTEPKDDQELYGIPMSFARIMIMMMFLCQRKGIPLWEAIELEMNRIDHVGIDDTVDVGVEP